MPELDKKATSVFAGKVVRKDLVRKVKVGANVPVFVLEYLLGKYCATDDPAAIDAGLRVVNTTLTENFVRPDEANAVRSKVKDKGKYTLIDKIKVRYLGAGGNPPPIRRGTERETQPVLDRQPQAHPACQLRF
jgi:ATP-dependent Lon protease